MTALVPGTACRYPIPYPWQVPVRNLLETLGTRGSSGLPTIYPIRKRRDGEASWCNAIDRRCADIHRRSLSALHRPLAGILVEQVFFFILVEDAHSRLVGGSNRPNTWYALASLRMVRRTVALSGHG